MQRSHQKFEECQQMLNEKSLLCYQPLIDLLADEKNHDFLKKNKKEFGKLYRRCIEQIAQQINTTVRFYYSQSKPEDLEYLYKDLSSAKELPDALSKLSKFNSSLQNYIEAVIVTNTTQVAGVLAATFWAEVLLVCHANYNWATTATVIPSLTGTKLDEFMRINVVTYKTISEKAKKFFEEREESTGDLSGYLYPKKLGEKVTTINKLATNGLITFFANCSSFPMTQPALNAFSNMLIQASQGIEQIIKKSAELARLEALNSDEEISKFVSLLRCPGVTHNELQQLLKISKETFDFEELLKKPLDKKELRAILDEAIKENTANQIEAKLSARYLAYQSLLGTVKGIVKQSKTYNTTPIDPMDVIIVFPKINVSRTLGRDVSQYDKIRMAMEAKDEIIKKPKAEKKDILSVLMDEYITHIFDLNETAHNFSERELVGVPKEKRSMVTFLSALTKCVSIHEKILLLSDPKKQPIPIWERDKKVFRKLVICLTKMQEELNKKHSPASKKEKQAPEGRSDETTLRPKPATVGRTAGLDLIAPVPAASPSVNKPKKKVNRFTSFHADSSTSDTILPTPSAPTPVIPPLPVSASISSDSGKNKSSPTSPTTPRQQLENLNKFGSRSMLFSPKVTKPLVSPATPRNKEDSSIDWKDALKKTDSDDSKDQNSKKSNP